MNEPRPPMRAGALANLLLVLVAALALVLRLRSLTGPDGALGLPADYDDAVYFSASALLVRGVLPYRDFVFVHPPGITYLLAAISWMRDPAAAFVIARFGVACVGMLNTILVGAIVGRAAGPAGAVVAAVLYATYPEALNAERSTYLEPFLNLLCLTSAWMWLREEQRSFTSGLVAGAACAVKFLGGIWVVAAVLSAARGRFARQVPLYVMGGSLAGAILLAPLALPALPQFVRETLTFQLARPADGTSQKIARLSEMLGGFHAAATLLAACALVAFAVRIIRGEPVSRTERFFAAATLLTIAAFLASSSYWSSYNAYLASSMCVLAGLGAGDLHALGVRWGRVPQIVATALLAALVIPAVRPALDVSKAHSDELPAVAQNIARHVPRTASVFAFDPAWTLAAGRLPPHDRRGVPVIVDSYGAMLLDAIDAGVRAGDTGAAFAAAPPNGALRARLEATDFVMRGWRGSWQMNQEDRSWFASRFLASDSSVSGPAVWVRSARPVTMLVVADGAVHFGDGWYPEEGSAPTSWRWMSGRSVMELPPVEGPAMLQLYFYVPASGGHSPTITISLDARVIDRRRVAGDEVVLSYDVPATPAARELVVATDRVFVPASDGHSEDHRELGLSLTRLVWLRRGEAVSAGRDAGASTSSQR